MSLSDLDIHNNVDIFVKSYYNKSVFLKDLNEGKVSLPVIAKPGSGSGSLGIIIVALRPVILAAAATACA